MLPAGTQGPCWGAIMPAECATLFRPTVRSWARACAGSFRACRAPAENPPVPHVRPLLRTSDGPVRSAATPGASVFGCKILDASNPTGYTPCVILRFRHKGLERLFTTRNASGVSAQHLRKIQLILGLLNVAREPPVMNAPGLHFHALTGDRNGQYAVSVSGN